MTGLRLTGLRQLSSLTQLEELNVAYNCHISDLTLLEWMTLTNLRVLNLEACSNIANRHGPQAPVHPSSGHMIKLTKRQRSLNPNKSLEPASFSPLEFEQFHSM